MFSSLAGTVLLGLLAAPQLVSGHMEMTWPPPLLSKYNPNTKEADKDSSYTSPLSPSGSDYPCKGHLSALSSSEGASVATFAPGQTYNFTIGGGAAHNGGSCQASLSYDQGKTFTVIQSYVGGCPLAASGNYDFTVPADAASGAAVFAWTWFNNIGNREMYMNCASVTIGGGSGKRELDPRGVAYSARPAMLAANIGNGCTTSETFDYEFPNPGPDVTTSSVAGHKFTGFNGNCGAAVATGSGGSSAAGGAATTAASVTTKAATSAATTAATSAALGSGANNPAVGSTTSTYVQVSSSSSSVGPLFTTSGTPPATTAEMSSTAPIAVKSTITFVGTVTPSALMTTVIQSTSSSSSSSSTSTSTPTSTSSFSTITTIPVTVKPVDPSTSKPMSTPASSSTAASQNPGSPANSPGVFVSGFTTASGTATLTMASSAATSAASSAKTTMDTSTTAAAAPTTTTAPAHQATSATSAAAPATTTTLPVTGGASAGQTYTAGQACTNEGAWNCIDGKSFQRCASGMWSAVMSMASGTSCQVGVGDTLNYSRKMRAKRWSLAARRMPLA